MKSIFKFLKISLFLIIILVVGIGSFMYYADQELDDTALYCLSIGENKYVSFMLRKKPFKDNYRGIYISPTNNENFNKNTDLDDLYMWGNHKKSSKKTIEFAYRYSQTISIYLNRNNLDMNVKDAFKGVLGEYKCEIIDHKTFYNNIRENFNKEKNKLKV